jgi:hypothetical protein
MVNIEQLSAKELYELAKKKEQEEARVAEMQEQLKKLETEREGLIKKHEEELAYTDRQIEELASQRERMIEGHNKALSILEQKLKTLREETNKAAAQEPAPAKEEAPKKPETEVAKAPAPAKEETQKKPETEAVKAPSPAKPKEGMVGEDLPPPSDDEPEQEVREKAKAKGGSEADELNTLMEHMHQIMKGRSYISDSLLREKLQSLKFKPANLSKLLDTLVRQARLVRRSGGNYVLGRKAGKK